MGVLEIRVCGIVGLSGADLLDRFRSHWFGGDGSGKDICALGADRREG